MGLIGYEAAPSPNIDKLIVTKINLGFRIRGIDDFGALSTYTKRFWADLKTGEIEIVAPGDKVSVKEIWNRSYAPTGSGTPVVMVQMRATDEDDWYDAGDRTGTITVETDDCTGTETSWSNVVGYADGSSVVYSLPCLATQARLHIGTRAVGIGPQIDTYSIDPNYPRQVTLNSSLDLDEYLVAYWDNEPYIRVFVGDIIETADGFHRIIGISSATQLELDWYPHKTMIGYHHPAKQMKHEEAETVIGMNHDVDSMQLRVVILPRNGITSAAAVDNVGISIVHVPSGPRVLKASR
jgi:hypothetical protein